MKNASWWGAAALAGWTLFAGARAEAQQRVAVLSFDGPAGARAQKHVENALSARSDVELVSSRLDCSSSAPGDFVDEGRDEEIAAFVCGDARKRGPRWVATIRVIDASTGQVLGEEPWPRQKPTQFVAIEGNFWRALGPEIQRASVPEDTAEAVPVAAATTAAAAKTTTTAATTPRPKARPAGDDTAAERPSQRPIVQGDILLGLLWRNLDYSDGDANLRSYHNTAGNPGFLMGFEAEYYPGGHVTDSRWADVGLEVDFDYTLGLSSNNEGEALETKNWDMVVGAVFRLPIDVFVPKFRFDYVRQVFEVGGDPDVVLLPDVAYSGLRMGFSFSAWLAEVVEVEFGMAYIYVLDAGELHGDRYFPRGTAGGADFETSVVYYPLPFLGVVVGAEWRRYGHDFKADPSFDQEGPAKLAGGAIDRYLKFDFGVRLQLNPNR